LLLGKAISKHQTMMKALFLQGFFIEIPTPFLYLPSQLLGLGGYPALVR
jgi:hypothetical protein